MDRENLEKIFGQVLRELRQEQGYSQEQLGFRSSYHRTYISLLERGLKSPTLNTLFDLAQALHSSPLEIIRRVEIRTQSATSVSSEGKATPDENSAGEAPY